jgi:hypothetical protein
MVTLVRRLDSQRRAARKRRARKSAFGNLFALAAIVLVVSFMYPPLVVALPMVLLLALGFLIIPLAGILFSLGFF